jgi:signal transduction histidine kinase/PAS domain-containing protein
MNKELERAMHALNAGDHLCGIYESADERLAVVGPFITEALGRGDRCLCIADAFVSDEIAKSLAATNVDVTSARANDALRFPAERETFLRLSHFDPRAMIEYLGQEEARALADGFSGLWLAAEMSWALAANVNGERLFEYETLLNQFLVNRRSVALDLYDRTRFDPVITHDILRTHRTVILNEQVCPNPYFEPPELISGQEGTASAEVKARRVGWWIEQLKRARGVERAHTRMVEQLEFEKARFEAVIQQMNAGVAVVEAPSGRLVLGNAQLEAIFSDSLLPITNVKDFAEFHGCRPDGRPYRAGDWPIARSIGEGETVWDEEISISRGGSRRTIRMSSAPIRDRSGAIIAAVATCHDITAQRLAGEAMLRYTARLKGLAHASLAINSAGSPAAVAQAATASARQLVDAHMAVTGFTADANWAQAIQSISLSDQYAAWKAYDEKPDGSGIYAAVCQTNQPMRLTQAELEAHPAWHNFGEAHAEHPPLRGWLAAPLVGRDGRNIGLIQLSDKTEGDFTPDDEAIVVQLAQVASVAIENAWLFEQVKAGRDHMQALSRQVLEVQEVERRHLARELHDEIGQALTGLRLVLKPQGDLRTEEDKAKFAQARAIADELLVRLRGLSFDLRPAALDEFGLLPALLVLFDHYSQRTGVEVVFKHDRVEGRYESDIETTAFRITQEALTNVARHSGTHTVTVRVWATADTLNVQVEDRGCGFDADTALRSMASHGLTGMRKRVDLVDGHLTIESTPETGTQITAELPLVRRSGI